jgi:ryanodine receptor 2
MNKPYIPHPIDTSHVELTQEILALTERLAENNHDIWARRRMSEGWKYGSQRDDERKLHPCLIPYGELPESEKEYDRATALEALKVILAAGYQITKAS